MQLAVSQEVMLAQDLMQMAIVTATTREATRMVDTEGVEDIRIPGVRERLVDYHTMIARRKGEEEIMELMSGAAAMDRGLIDRIGSTMRGGIVEIGIIGPCARRDGVVGMSMCRVIARGGGMTE